jgi:hypothetical protein
MQPENEEGRGDGCDVIPGQCSDWSQPMNTETVAEPKAPRQIADDIERWAVTAQVEANRVTSLSSGIVDAADRLRALADSEREALATVINFAELIALQVTKIGVCCEQIEITCHRASGEAVA